MNLLIAAIFLFAAQVSWAGPDFGGHFFRPKVSSASAPGAIGAGGGGGGGGFDLTIDTVAWSFTDSNHFLDINYTFTDGVDGVCAIGAAKDGSAQITAATLAGAPLLRVAASPRSSGYQHVAIFCGTATPSGVQEIEFVKTSDSPMLGAVIGLKGMKQTGYDFIHSSGNASDITTTATSVSTGSAITVAKNILIGGAVLYSLKDITPEAGDTQLTQFRSAAATLIVTFQNANAGSPVTLGASWTGGERVESCIVEVNDDPLEAP